ncbi:hypothetical protein C1J01_17440 [Nonomuraea aridisoli]|uniref:Peptidase M16 C-terminal domain-containing protein n=2 Tax=Nonomuraea aridisoli TaxID=2070368 RepID=A0A2W2E0Z8_9ACTN|nr:hypothetical protein C1J01_17440 [Nonomuraea aridisoli]
MIVELPLGHHDDPPEQRGLAAVAARWLADVREPLGAARGRRTRHRLAPHSSSFSYWSCLDDLSDVPDRFGLATPPPDADRLNAIRRAQLRLSETRAADSRVRLLDALEQASWGEPAPTPLGDATTLSRITPDSLTAYLAACHRLGITIHRAPGRSTGVPAAAPVSHRRWRGGLTTVSGLADSRARVAVRLPLDPSTVAPGAVDVLAEVLGTGIDGVLPYELRISRGLTYSVGVLRWGADEPVTIGAKALVEPGDAAPAARLMLDVIRACLRRPPSAELRRAAERARTSLLLQADDPFGAVDELRRRARSEHTATELAEAIREHAAQGLTLAPAPGAPPAIAAVGPLTQAQQEVLEGVR